MHPLTVRGNTPRELSAVVHSRSPVEQHQFYNDLAERVAFEAGYEYSHDPPRQQLGNALDVYAFLLGEAAVMLPGSDAAKDGTDLMEETMATRYDFHARYLHSAAERTDPVHGQRLNEAGMAAAYVFSICEPFMEEELYGEDGAPPLM